MPQVNRVPPPVNLKKFLMRRSLQKFLESNNVLKLIDAPEIRKRKEVDVVKSSVTEMVYTQAYVNP